MSSHTNLGARRWQHLISSFQILLNKEHKKKVISTFNIISTKNTILITLIAPLKHSFSNTKSVPIASQQLKDCLGIAWGNQINSHHLTTGSLALMFSQVSALVQWPDFEGIHTAWSESPIEIKLSLLCFSTKLSDLSGFQYHSLLLITLETLASKVLAASYMILAPYFWIRTPSGCHQSCQRKMLLLVPTSNLTKGLTKFLRFKIFLHTQELFWGAFTHQKLFPFKR